MVSDHVKLNNTTIENETIVLPAKSTFKHTLGLDLKLVNCSIVVKTYANGLSISGASFVDCTFQLKRPLRNFRWNSAYLENCRFVGTMTGNDFGARSNPVLGWSGAGIENCDFRQSVIHAARFMNTDIESHQLPSWPHFVISVNEDTYDQLRSVDWPSQEWQDFIVFYEVILPGTTATIDNAEMLIKEFGGSEKQLRATLSQLDCVIYS